MKTSHSPLKERPPRQPGQSLREKADGILEDEILNNTVTAFLIFVLICLCWVLWLWPAMLHPLIFTIVGGLAIGFFLVRIIHRMPDLHCYRQGQHGEEYVGSYLERELGPKGCRLVHDLIFHDRFNIDHVIVCTRGVYTVNTKTISKPGGGGKVAIHFDGERIAVHEHQPDAKWVEQARGEARDLQRLLGEFMEEAPTVRPVLVFPEWFVDQTGRSEVWALNEKAVAGFIWQEPETLTADTVERIYRELIRRQIAPAGD